MKPLALLSIDLLAAGAKEPPTEVRLFQRGTTETLKGAILFDDRSVELVTAAFTRIGRDLPFDYEHAATLAPLAADPAEAGKAAGWFRVECRADGCWATKIKWTANAQRKIADREYRYVSPTIRHDGRNRVVEIVACALTNQPATLNPTPLILSSAGAPNTLTHEQREVCRLLGVSPDAVAANISGGKAKP